MKRPAALIPIALALGVITLAPGLVRAQDFREEGPIEIEKCQTISKSGSYKLVNNLTFTGATGACLNITVSNVTIDLSGFTISGPGSAFGFGNQSTAILAAAPSGQVEVVEGISVRSGSISGFGTGVGLGDGSIVEGLRVSGPCPCFLGIGAAGIVRGNTVVGIADGPGSGVGISATGIITGNYVISSRLADYQIGQGSTVIGNTAVGPGLPGFGFIVSCPSNVTDNTAVNNPGGNLVLNGNGCNNTNNVAP